MSVLRGIDVSHWKKDLNSNGVAADFVIAKATGGTGYVDDACDKFVQEAIAGGRKWGVYHYYSDGFGGDDPIAEANWFVDNCLGYVGHGLLILDWERGGNPHVTDVGKAKAWLDHVFARTGVRPLIYMSGSLVSELDWSPVIAGNYGLWLAAWPNGNNPVRNYGMDPALDPNPHWDGVVNDCLWQFTSTGRLDGYGGNLDCNFFYGTREAWDSYAGTHAPAPEPTTTTTTESPQPEPTTTTTTEEPTTTTTTVEPTPEPEPTTTTTTEVEPEPPTTTTTTVVEPPTPTDWATAVIAALVAAAAVLWSILFK